MVTKLIAQNGGNFTSSIQSFVYIENKKIIVDGDTRSNPSPPPSTLTMVSTQSFVKIENIKIGMVGDVGATTTNTFVYIEV